MDRGACGLQTMRPQRIEQDWVNEHTPFHIVDSSHLLYVYHLNRMLNSSLWNIYYFPDQRFQISPASWFLIIKNKHYPWISMMAQIVKNLPEMQETQVWSLGQEDPLEKGMTIYFGILAWRIPRREEPGRLQSIESQRVRHDWMTNTFTFNEMCQMSFVIAKLLVSCL